MIFLYYKMINLDSITNENIPDNPSKIVIIGGSGSRKTNTLLNLINEQNDTDKVFFHMQEI